VSDLTAWGDESGGHSTKDPGVYILCASVITADMVSDARSVLRGLKPAAARKLHWREPATGAQRRKIVDQIGELGLSHIVVVRLSATDTARRQRAKALEMLCVELESVGVQEFTLESRGPADDQRDLKTLAGLRSRRLVSPDLRMWHAPGPQEPLLWIADVCAGVVSDARIGDDLHHGLLANHITVHEIH
jgi:hypothetical protein